MKKPVPKIIETSYVLMFDFQMEDDMTDIFIHELGIEVSAAFQSFFAAKRHPLPTYGTLSIMREVEGELYDIDEPAIPRKRSNSIRNREKDTPRGNK